MNGSKLIQSANGGAMTFTTTHWMKEQASQIQKVSAQVEMSKPAPQTVLNNQ
jgi:hypothetical protein